METGLILVADGNLRFDGGAHFGDRHVARRFIGGLNAQHSGQRHLELAAQARQRGAAVSDQTLLAILRKWFWARKPDAGFLLSGFPATLLHARVFDEWLEAREEVLTGCLCPEPRSALVLTKADAAKPAVIEHYRTLGLLLEFGPSAVTPV